MSKIVLLSVVLLLEGVWEVRGHRTFQPCGPKLCETFYQRYIDCSVKTFDEIQLSCQLTAKRPPMDRSCLTSLEGNVESGGCPAMESSQRKNSSNSKEPDKPDDNELEPGNMLAPGVHQVPEQCLEEPNYVNQGAIEKRKFCKPGYPVVIEYECDQMAEEKYKYHSGAREALCDDQGNWTLPAMSCFPTRCYTIYADRHSRNLCLYSGNTHQDKDGRECQAWTEDKPHKPTSKFGLYSACIGCEYLKDIGNKCRAMSHQTKPWCYTMDPKVRSGECDIPECKTERRCARHPFLYYASAIRTELVGEKVHVTYKCHKNLQNLGGGTVSICDMVTGVWKWPRLKCGSENCYHFDHIMWGRVIYLGNCSTTVSGKTCQRWDSPTLHKFKIKTSRIFGATTLSGLGNLCRGPKGKEMPGCFITDHRIKWESCPVPECSLPP